MKVHTRDTTISIDPETNKDLDELISNIQPKTNKKELLRFLVKRYKDELGLVAEVRV